MARNPNERANSASASAEAEDNADSDYHLTLETLWLSVTTEGPDNSQKPAEKQHLADQVSDANQAKRKEGLYRPINRAQEVVLNDTTPDSKRTRSIESSPALTAPMLLSMLTILSLIPHAGRGNSDVPTINPQGMAHPCDRLSSEGASPHASQFHVFGASNTDENSIACVRDLAHGAESPFCVTDPRVSHLAHAA